MSDSNPYATPGAALGGATSESIQLYSPIQVACGTLLGGPMGGVYFIYSNFRRLDKLDQARNTLIGGGLLFALLVVLVLTLPDNIPRLPFTIAAVVIACTMAENLQMSKSAIQQSPDYDFRSNWHVLMAGLLAAVVTTALLLGLVFAMMAAGLIR